MVALRKRADVIERDGKGRCAFCRFDGLRGMVSYRDGSRKIIACYPCFASEHALVSHGKRGRLAFIPETSQAQISHLGRTLVWLKETTGIRNAADLMSNRRNLYARDSHWLEKTMSSAFALYEELTARADVLEKVFSDSLDTSPHLGIARLPEDVQAQLAHGLRFLPAAFTQGEVNSWRQEGSTFDGLGSTLLSPEHDWFVSTIER